MAAPVTVGPGARWGCSLHITGSGSGKGHPGPAGQGSSDKSETLETEWYSAQTAPRVGGSTPALKTPGSHSFLSSLLYSTGLVTDQGGPLLAPGAVWAHLEHGGLGAAGAGALPARRSSSHPPACCSGPENLLQTASAGWSPIAEKGHRERELVTLHVIHAH